MEWGHVAYEGLTTEEIHASRPNRPVFRDGCPDGQSPELVQQRADRLIARMRARGRPEAVFAHGHCLGVLPARWIDLAPLAAARLLLAMANLSVLSHDRGIPAIGGWNVPMGSEEAPED